MFITNRQTQWYIYMYFVYLSRGKGTVNAKNHVSITDTDVNETHYDYLSEPVPH
jgi:hypothetical protein